MTRATADWDGARNLFDLGGLPTVNGGPTAYGRVWRSAAPEWMTTAGWRAAHNAGLVRVVDLRNEIEVGRQPSHPVIDESALEGIEVVRAPTEDPDDPEFIAECGPWLDHPRSWTPNAERFPDKFARVFTAIADAPGPTLVHCAGGKDRTGLVVSMLLALSGVEHDAIADYYEQGFRGARNYPGDVDQAIADRTPAVLQWLRQTDVADYLTSAGIDSARLERLRTLLSA